MKKRLIPIILIFSISFFHSFCFSQNTKIDSIRSLLKKDQADTTKINHLNDLVKEYNNIGSSDSALQFANYAIQLCNIISKGTSDSILKQELEKDKAYALNYIGIIYKNQGNYPEALKNYVASLRIREKIADKKGEAGSYGNIGLVYAYQGNYPEALKNYFTSLKIFETIGNKKGVSNSYNGIGNVYYSQGNYPEALKNHFAALKIREALGDKKGEADSYGNIGLVYYEQGNYQEALKSHLASLKIEEVIGDKKGVAGSYNNIGLVYENQGNYSEALKNYFASLKIKETIGDKKGIANSYYNIGAVYTKQKKFNEAEVFLFKAKELAKKIGYKEGLKYTYNNLAKLDSAIGNFKSAFENRKLYILYRDSLDNEETRKKTIQSQMTYDFEKKEAVATAEHKKELENQQLISEVKSHKQKIVLFLVIASLILVLFFSGFIFRSLKITRKQKNIIALQKEIVEQRKQEVEHQKLLVEEKQKEIIDSITYAKRLQQAILPSDEEIKKYLPDSFVLYKPKDIVAGDFYWMHISPKEDFVFIAAADSTGHGVPGAMVSVVCSNALNRAVNEFSLIDTGKILDKTRELVLETFAKSGEEIKDGMDISLLSLKFEVQSSKIIEATWSGANNPLWCIRQIHSAIGGMKNAVQQREVILQEIKPDKQSIGKTDHPKPFTTHIVELNSGDTFYLITDGYADQFGGEKGKKYKYKNLQEKLIASTNLSLAKQKDCLLDSFNSWKGNLEQVDDVTIIAIRI